MITSFRDRETELIWRNVVSRRLPTKIQRVALRKLLILDKVKSLKELRYPPGNRLEALRGDRADQWSIRINDQWRVCFRWSDGDASEVEIVDYH
jgi:toxin HigB-1